MSLKLQDLPLELLLQVLETGCEQELLDDLNMPLLHQWRRYSGIPNPDRDYLLFNNDFTRKRKKFCCSLAAASKFWLNVINETPSCWVLMISLPGVFFSFKYDISMEIARLKSNLDSTNGCDIAVLCNQTRRNYAFSNEHFNPHHVMSMLMLHALRLLRPHGSRIIYLDVAMWNTDGFATAIAILRSFGTLPRLRKLLMNEHGLDPEAVDEFALSTATPFRSILDFPSHHDEIDLWDMSSLAHTVDYETAFISTATKLPPNLTRLTITMWTSSVRHLTCATLEAVLAQSPGLERLTCTLYDAPQDASFGTVSKQRTIQLKHLFDFQLTTPHSKVVWAILTRLGLPRLRYLQIASFIPGGGPLNPSDNFEPVAQIEPLTLPSLSGAYFYDSPPGMVSPLHCIDLAKPLGYVSYHIRSSEGGTSSHPIRSGVATLQAKSISISSDASKDPYLPMISLLDQHDLSPTSILNISGPRRGERDGMKASLPPCVDAWLKNPKQAFEALPVNHIVPIQAPQLDRLGFNHVRCLHIVDFFFSLLAPGDGFERMDLYGVRCCQAHQDSSETLVEDSSHYEDRRKRFSRITFLSINVHSLAPTQGSLAIHPFWAFPNLQVLSIQIACEYAGICPYKAEILNEYLDFLKFERALASLRHLARLIIAVNRSHNDATDYSHHRDHEDFQSVVRAVVKAVRQLAIVRSSIGSTPIRETYLEIQAWFSRSPMYFVRLR